MTKEISFCGIDLSLSAPPVIVAEIGFNHNGDVGLAREMILKAKENGADAVKLQTFVGEKLYSKNYMADDPENPGETIPFYQFFERHQLSWQDYERLFALAEDIKIPLFSTPFDSDSLRRLIDLGMPAIKIASGDLTHSELLGAAARCSVPIVLSTGMASMDEVMKTVNLLKAQGAEEIVVLHCVSNYPALESDMNLSCLNNLRETTGLPVGLSDHSLAPISAMVATTMGAVMIEKHFTSDRNLPGVDQAISLEPQELKQLKDWTVKAHQSIGDGVKAMRLSEEETKRAARRCLIARQDINAGEEISSDMLTAKRPGPGIPAEEIRDVIGRQSKVTIAKESFISRGQLS